MIDLRQITLNNVPHLVLNALNALSLQNCQHDAGINIKHKKEHSNINMLEFFTVLC